METKHPMSHEDVPTMSNKKVKESIHPAKLRGRASRLSVFFRSGCPGLRCLSANRT